MKKMFLLILAGFLVTGMAFAQEMPEKVGSGDVFKGKSRGDDANIKAPKRLNSVTMETQVVKPTEKGAKADSRGSGSGSCYVKFDNWSPWYIDCYIDGYFEGYVAPYADGNLTVGSGSTCLYAVAEFDDGSKVSWGPVCKNCYYQDFELEVFETYYNWYLE
jgi:hypothetical protein